MTDFVTSRDHGPFGISVAWLTPAEALWRLEQEGFSDSQSPTARKVLWKRRFEHLKRVRAGVPARDLNCGLWP